MGEALSTVGRKALAAGVLVVVAFVAFKLLVGFVTGLLWMAVVVLAVVAVIWALRVLQGVELAVILFFFGLSAGVIAKIKGSSFVVWFLIGFCLPFFGTLAALVARNEREEPLRACPVCGNVLPISDQLCSRCGAELDFPEPEPAAPRQERLFEA